MACAPRWRGGVALPDSAQPEFRSDPRWEMALIVGPYLSVARERERWPSWAGIKVLGRLLGWAAGEKEKREKGEIGLG